MASPGMKGKWSNELTVLATVELQYLKPVTIQYVIEQQQPQDTTVETTFVVWGLRSVGRGACPAHTNLWVPTPVPHKLDMVTHTCGLRT